MQAKLPVVVIVGRPNVGKSTFYNRIAGRRIAVVEDSPGITRDRLYYEVEWYGYKMQFVDTGGILFGDEDPLVEQIRVQAEVALVEADIVLFMVDIVSGLSAGDQELAHRLRMIKVPVFVLANKADNRKRADFSSEFYELGFENVYPVSGLNGHGVSDLMDAICEHLPKVESLPMVKEEVRLAIVGRPNVGKSSILNAFTGEERSIVSNIPGTTRDAIDTLVQYKGEPFRLIDTAGLRRKGKIQGTVEYYMAMRATQALERAECALVLVDASEGLTDGDKRTMKLSHDEGRALVIAINKWDLKEDVKATGGRLSPLKKDFLKIIHDQVPEVKYAPVCFTSAKESSGLEKVLDHVLMAVDSWNFRIGTGHLNRIIQESTFERPYTSKGKQLRIYFATQVSTRPPTFVLFCNDPDLFHFSYQRYIENCLRKVYPLPGTPLKIIPRARTSKDD
ncbi:MAG: ribosome biogenesis GTPase Der [Chthonomonas sp.]|nr:ribosome biogenesis GTPase Der [Chthonomonas sp.]